MLYIGLKGLILTLYYSDLDAKENNRGEVLTKIGWNAQMENDGETYMHTDSVQDVFKKARKASDVIRVISVDERLKYISQLKKMSLTLH